MLLLVITKMIAPLIIAGIIAAVGSIIGGIVKNKADKNANQAQVDYNNMAYGRQRADSLADYAMQNDYNSPTSQMARLRQAGINPMYAAGNLSTQSATVRSSDYNSYQPRPVDYSGAIEGATGAASSTLLGYYDVQMKQAQIDNLKANNTVILEEAELKKLQAAQIKAGLPGIDTRNQTLGFDLSQKQRLADTQADMAAEQLRSYKVSNDIKLQENERAQAMNASNLREAVARITRMRVQNLRDQLEMTKIPYERDRIEAEIRDIQARANSQEIEGQIKALDRDLKSKGIQPHDNFFLRTLGEFMDVVAPYHAQHEGFLDKVNEWGKSYPWWPRRNKK